MARCRRRCGGQIGRVGFVDWIVQGVSGGLAFVLLELGEHLLCEVFSGGGDWRCALGQWCLDPALRGGIIR